MAGPPPRPPLPPSRLVRATGLLRPQIMPPQTRAAARRVASPTPLDALPLPLALRIFALLPADARLCAAAVCRTWRAMLADPALWTRLDLSEESGVANPSVALLRAAAARAGGRLEVLRTTCWSDRAFNELRTVLRRNVTMLELSVNIPDTPFQLGVVAITSLLRDAPRLRLLEIGMQCDDTDALPVLRKEAQFASVCLNKITLTSIEDYGWPAVAAGLTTHTSLKDVMLYGWPVAQAESDAVVGALVSLPQLCCVCLSSATASMLARLLSCPTLTSLRMMPGGHLWLLDSPASAALLCDALRANTQLETLVLGSVDLWHNMDAAAALVTALQTHPSLQTFELSVNFVRPEHAVAAGNALGALIANSPALTTLDITHCDLGDAGLGPIVDALPRARHLRTLHCAANDMSEAFARERLLPAVRDCASLRTLHADHRFSAFFAGEVLTLLQQRRR